MRISIGERLKKLRKNKGLTQEELAEALGVSPQAVSRWECDSAYPDITLLPGIANFYDTTVDEIVGMDEIRRDETVREIHTDALRLVSAGNISDAVSCLRDGLRLYPNNPGLLLALGETLAHSEDAESAAEAVSLFERARRSDGLSAKAKSTAAVNLVFLYQRLGKTGEAAEIVKSLPHIWESREIMMPEMSDDYKEALRRSIIWTLAFFRDKISGADGRRTGEIPGYFQLGASPALPDDSEELIAIIRTFLTEKQVSESF